MARKGDPRRLFTHWVESRRASLLEAADRSETAYTRLPAHQTWSTETTAQHRAIAREFARRLRLAASALGSSDYAAPASASATPANEEAPPAQHVDLERQAFIEVTAIALLQGAVSHEGLKGGRSKANAARRRTLAGIAYDYAEALWTERRGRNL